MNYLVQGGFENAAAQHLTIISEPDTRMRCEPCKIRFLEVPWFLGHLVRCPKWKENSSDVIDYFSMLSKKKLVILRGPNKKKTSSALKTTSPANIPKRSPPPTCFTCFCGKSFMSQIRHSAHVQECLAKVMSKTKNPSVTTPATTTTAKHTVVQLDEDHFKVIIQGSDSRHITQEEVSFHIDGEGQEIEVAKDAGKQVSEDDNLEQKSTGKAEDPLDPSSFHIVKEERLEDIEVVENVILPAEPPSEDAQMGSRPHSADSVTIGHKENAEVLERDVMMKKETLTNPELNETVLRLEYFEENSKQDGSQQVDVANEIEVGTYEDVAQEFVVNYEEQEEEVGEELIRGRLPSIRPLDKTLDIESTECDCGKELRNTDDITAHLEVCSVYSNQTPCETPSSRKTVVLITCVCTGKFSKTDIKEHLLHCATWKYVKHKKNLEGGRGHTNDPQSGEGNMVCDTVKETPNMATGDPTEEEEPRVVSGSEGNECDDASQYIIEEIINAPSVKENASGVDDDYSTFGVNTEKPKVTYKCECGALFRHMNVFKVHQTSCSKHLRYQGQADEMPLTSKPKVNKEDLLLKYSAPMQGEVLVNRQCQCGLVIDSICAYRNHTVNCLLSQAARKKNKTKVEVTAKKLTLSQKRTSDFKRESDETNDDDTTSGLKKSKVELRDELKDFVKLPGKETILRTHKRK